MESLKTNLYILSESRRLGYNLVQNTSPEEMLIIPEGFSNNIFWLLGHISFAQKKLISGLSKLDPRTPDWMAEYFGPGTSPKNWKSLPDINFILESFTLAPIEIENDFKNQLFSEFIPYTTKMGTVLNSFEEALAFNNFHEGLHLGQMLNIRRIISLNKSQSQKEK